jgi:dihydrofolate synthase / folylpolyglutamate synthase
VDGAPVPDEAIAAAATRLRPAIERSGATFFEATTAIALLCFRESGVDTAVVEVGLGGRLDSTNVLAPVACAITNVSSDHTEYLGDEIEAIAREKAGILKTGVPAVTGAEGAALDVIRRVAAERDVPLRSLEEMVQVVGVEPEGGGSRAHVHSGFWGERSLPVPLAGPHQVRNAVLAAELLGLLPDGIRPSWTAIEAGFGAVRWPGRMQVERRSGTTFLLDVAHNDAGVDALVRTVPTLDLPRPHVLVVSILADKRWPEMLSRLAGGADAVILTVPASAPQSRVWDPEAAAAFLRERAPGKRVRIVRSVAAAVQRAATLAPHGTVLVTGSFHTVGDAMAALDLPTD